MFNNVSIGRILKIAPESAFHRQVIVEFNTRVAVQEMDLLISYEHPTRAGVIYEIQALAEVYTPTAASSATTTFMEELHALAKLSGQSFESMLKEELERLTVATTQTGGEPIQDVSVEHNPTPIQVSFSAEVAPPTKTISGELTIPVQTANPVPLVSVGLLGSEIQRDAAPPTSKNMTKENVSRTLRQR